MTIRWVYLDESEFQLNSITYVAYGALITEEKNLQDNINRALATLRELKNTKDKDYLPKNDDRTLERRYFHACDDACCAHYAICKEIENINGEISLNCIPKSNDVNLNALSLTSGISGLYHNGYAALIYEQRTGLTEKIVNDLILEYEKNLILNYANSLFMPIYFSEAGYKISNKSEPGIQFVDFILWAYQRKLNGNSDWYNRIVENSKKNKGIQFISEYVPKQDNKDYFLNLTLNKGLSLSDTNGIYNDKNLNNKYLSVNNFDDINDVTICESLLLANEIIGKIEYNKNPQHYFGAQIKDGIENRKNNLENFLVVFLKMFDTFNFLNLTSNINVKNKMLLARKIIALSFCYNYPNRVELQEKLQNFWKKFANLLD